MIGVENNKVAILIDPENISADYAERIIEEASTYGDVIIKRVFSDWSNSNTQKWKDKSIKLGLKAEHMFVATKNKNGSDIALVINAMTMLLDNKVHIDVFCIASSDSDFTRLVQELRENGREVIGFGKRLSASAYVNAFNEFIYLDKADDDESLTQNNNVNGANNKVAPKPKIGVPLDRLNYLKGIIEELIETKGKAYFATLGQEIKKKYPDFLPKNYGYSSIRQLVEQNLTKLGAYVLGVEKDHSTQFIALKEIKKSKDYTFDKISNK